MKTMEGILKEELLRLKETEKSYAREIQKLPRGSLQSKRIKGNVYLYLVSSKASKLSYRYLGGLPEGELQKLKANIALRKKYQGLLKGVRQDIQRMTKIVHGRKRAI